MIKGLRCDASFEGAFIQTCSVIWDRIPLWVRRGSGILSAYFHKTLRPLLFTNAADLIGVTFALAIYLR